MEVERRCAQDERPLRHANNEISAPARCLWWRRSSAALRRAALRPAAAMVARSPVILLLVAASSGAAFLPLHLQPELRQARFATRTAKPSPVCSARKKPATTSDDWAGNSYNPFTLASREQLSNPAYWVGAIYLLSFMGQLATISAAKLGLITLPPINTFTEIADAAMEMGVADGSVNPYTATAYSWGIWLDLLQSYNAGASVAAWCADAPAHSAWCEAAKVL